MVVNAWKDDLTNRISLADPILGDEEKEALCGVIDSGWMTMGERVAEFERSFANLHRVEDAIAVSSCTAGLHLTLQALGIEQGDEVLVPSLTFVATVNAISYVNAAPVFVDIYDEKNPHISIEDAEIKCTSRTSISTFIKGIRVGKKLLLCLNDAGCT